MSHFGDGYFEGPWCISEDYTQAFTRVWDICKFCWDRVSILSFIDWSSLDIAKHVASNTFHEHYGFSMEKNICKTVFSDAVV